MTFDQPMDFASVNLIRYSPNPNDVYDVIAPPFTFTVYDTSGAVLVTLNEDHPCDVGQYCQAAFSVPTRVIKRIRYEIAANKVTYFSMYGTAHNLPPPLQVTCTPSSVVRADTTSCTASTSVPNATLSIVQWMFSGTGGISVVSIDTSLVTWRGPLVLGGTVSVIARLNSTLDTASAPVSALARSWGGAMPYPTPLPLVVTSQSDFPDPPVYDSAGKQVWRKKGLAFYEFGVNPVYNGPNGEVLTRFMEVQSGPNNGLVYAQTPPNWFVPVVKMSEYLNPGNPFYEAQTGKRKGEGNPQGYPGGWCTKTHMNTLKKQVLTMRGPSTP